MDARAVKKTILRLMLPLASCHSVSKIPLAQTLTAQQQISNTYENRTDPCIDGKHFSDH
jgi:hypothetical protein